MTVKTADNCLYGRSCLLKTEMDCSQCFNHIVFIDPEDDFYDELKEMP